MYFRHQRSAHFRVLHNTLLYVLACKEHFDVVAGGGGVNFNYFIYCDGLIYNNALCVEHIFV